ncbi:MAG: hypothetical protein PHX25_03410 [Candidatus Pacebacteria bacterium]|nr:hypothetical protein [Candidatus Paceibacterota bacterium]
MKKITKIIGKYYPDMLILIGIYILSFFLFLKPRSPLSIDLNNYYTEEKVLGVMLISFGINILIRRYFKN